ncbi:hypothetical protein GCM10009550_08120 [Actinocorallia libanotica]|uniref:Uncharacterized protein n=1 Tax=Actinocorallia libanotica TaxID=46162 RepID=A0ABN1QAM5_9ACTN
MRRPQGVSVSSWDGPPACVTVSLLVGDLGYPKTEHSERVAMKAVMAFRFSGYGIRALGTGTEREFS